MKPLLLSLCLMVHSVRAADEPKPETIKHRIVGMFEPARADLLRELFKDHPEVKLLELDFARGEGTFSYDPKTYSADSLDQWIHVKTFRIKAASNTPSDKLTTGEIPVLALDCKGCCFALHNFAMDVEGVQQATPLMKEGIIKVLFDPAKTNMAALQEALKSRNVRLKEAPAPAAAQ